MHTELARTGREAAETAPRNITVTAQDGGWKKKYGIDRFLFRRITAKPPSSMRTSNHGNGHDIRK